MLHRGAKKPARGGDEAQNVAAALHNARMLRDAYHYDDMKFPQHAIALLQTPLFGTWARQTQVYYDNGASRELVHQLLGQREPVNIAMVRSYDAKKLHDAFGWHLGKYQRHYNDTRTLAPNIGVYCYTPYIPVNAQDVALPVSRNGYAMLHVYNAIGYAFDTPHQPDYQALVHTLTADEVQDALVPLYARVLYRAFICAQKHSLTTVAMGLVGLGAFAQSLRDLDAHMPEDVFKRAFALAREWSGYRGAVRLMTRDWDFSYRRVSELGDAIGHFPACLRVLPLDQTLIVNAWDPHSMAGNGNFRDNSLDGHVGRRTAIALLCWPYTNPHITDVAVQ